MTGTKDNKKRELVVLTIQADYLAKVVEQLQMIFGDLIAIRPLQFNSLAVEKIHPHETVFSTTEGIIRTAKKLFPKTRRFITAKRSINLVNTGELLSITPGKRVLVINDTKANTESTVNELIESGFRHDYLPYFPGCEVPDDIDHVITCGEMELIPPNVVNAINLGFRVISLETIIELNDCFGLGLNWFSLYRLHAKSMVICSQKWPVLDENKYISSWIGTRKESIYAFRFSDMIAHSEVMKNLVFMGKKMAVTEEAIHISGEPGVGKRRVAQAVHNESNRSSGPFCSISCAVKSREALEKELFGWEGEAAVHPGLIDSAGQGTLCIENIENLPEDLQFKLTQALTEKTYTRHNGVQPIKADVRIVTTSDVPIDILHQQNRIRKELYLMLAPFSCQVPSLAERQEDFDEIVDSYLRNDLHKADLQFDPETTFLLKHHKWEGNIQELYNILSQLVCLDENPITPNLLPFYIKRKSIEAGINPAEEDFLNEKLLISEIEKNGFLEENLEILRIYAQGKQENKSFGRSIVQKLLRQNDINLTMQQLRLRQERLNDLGLLNVRLGRSGTTISKKGELFLKKTSDIVQ